MSKDTKAEAEVATAVVETHASPQALIESQAASQALTTSHRGLPGIPSDIDIPKLNVIQKTSQIEGPVGSVVIDKENVLVEAETKIPVIIIGAVKRWKEDIPYDDDTIPKIVNTEAESRALAEVSNFDVTEFAEIILLIPQTGEDDSNFPYPIGDTNYQIGRIIVQRDAYRLTFKRLFTFQSFNPNTPVASRFWNFGTELMSKGKYNWFVPTLSVTKDATPTEVGEFVERLTHS